MMLTGMNRCAGADAFEWKERTSLHTNAKLDAAFAKLSLAQVGYGRELRRVQFDLQFI